MSRVGIKRRSTATFRHPDYLCAVIRAFDVWCAVRPLGNVVDVLTRKGRVWTNQTVNNNQLVFRYVIFTFHTATLFPEEN